VTPVRFPVPDQSWAMLVGTMSHANESLPDLPGVAGNLADFHTVLTDPGLGGLRSAHCSVVVDPPLPGALGVQLANAARRAADTLIVYYAGHGLLDDRGNLFLALSDTNPDHVDFTALPLAWIRRAFAESPARNRILILDCCFSGRAIEAMAGTSSLVSGQIEIAGGYTLASAPANEPARAPAGQRNTAFTAELLRILRDGIDDEGQGLELGRIFMELRRAHLEMDLPQPQQRTTSTADRLALVRNARYSDTPRPGSASAAAPVPTSPAAPGTHSGSASQARAAEPDALPAVIAPWAPSVEAWQAGDLEKAEQMITAAAGSSDSRTRAASAIVHGLIRRDGFRDLPAAQHALTRAADTGDSAIAPLALLHRGSVQELQGNVAQAQEDYAQAAWSRDPEWAAQAELRLGWLLLDAGSVDDASRVLRRGQEIGHTSAGPWLALGLAECLMRSHQTQLAADQFSAAESSDNATVRAHAALRLRQICIENGFMTDAADYARSVADNPAAVDLWPVVMSDERPATPEGRIYAMSRWLTWLRSGPGEYICFTSEKGPGHAIVVEREPHLSMAVLIELRALPQKRRRYLKANIADELETIGFSLDQEGEEPAGSSTPTWVMDVGSQTDQALATLAEGIMTDLLIGRINYTLATEFEPKILTPPPAKPPPPDLLPRYPLDSPATRRSEPPTRNADTTS
jgi:tetratricopeptide (TPR) repeat protein